MKFNTTIANLIKTKIAILFYFFLFIFCSSTTSKKEKGYFEGKISYKNEYLIKSNKVDSAFFNRAFGKTAVLLFKNGNYFEKYDGGTMLEQFYIRKENKIYIKKSQSDTLYWTDCGIANEKMLKYKINKKREIILGIECDELVTYYKNKIVSFYFNSDTLKINPDWYKDFKVANKNMNIQVIKALYLKYKFECADFIATVTATSISQQKVDNDVFIIPRDKILIEEK